jgi:hypothetical protein
MLNLDTDTRAGRMLEAGRLTATFRSPTGAHITLTVKSRKKDGERWVGCPLDEAMVMFIAVKSADGGWDDKVGKVTQARGFVADRNADPARVWCAKQLLRWVQGQPTAPSLEIMEESRCGRCGRALTDPVSIERGIGPECYGARTGSQHQVKHDTLEQHATALALAANGAAMGDSDSRT